MNPPKERKIELKNSTHPNADNIVSSGKPKSGENLKVTFFLKPNASPKELKDIDSFKSLKDKSTNIINRKDFKNAHGAHKNDINLVKQFAKEQGLKVTEINTIERYMDLSGSIHKIEKAFNIEIFYFLINKTHSYYHLGTIKIPEYLEHTLESISGIGNELVHTKKIFPDEKTLKKSLLKGQAVKPEDFEKYYNFPKTLNGKGQCIAIISLGGGYDDKLLNEYFNNIGVPMPDITWVGVDGAENIPGINLKYDYEIYMDVEIIGALAPAAKIVVYFADSKRASMIKAFKKAIHDSNNAPHIISMSWGALEKKFNDSESNSLNQALKEAANLNITVLTSSGDLGSSGETPNEKTNEKELNVELPASNPFVLACGGSEIHQKDGVILHEDVWSQTVKLDKSYDISSGSEYYNMVSAGGYSKIWDMPIYQQNTVPLKDNPNCKRGIPDVAANASTWPGIKLSVGGTEQISMGTSAAAPLWAALIARINQQLENEGLPNVGFVNPLLYHDEIKKTFNPVIEGNNGAYKAGIGWNPCTGLGTPNGVKLMNAIIDQYRKELKD